jgi:hypothetical protein
MVDAMTKHVMTSHPDTAAKMKKMHEENPENWGNAMKPKWEAVPKA